ncbi:MAG: alpha-amylase family glycosyl hydrolase [Bacteroidota bacterium]
MTKKISLVLFGLLLASSWLSAQLVSSDPIFPKASDPVTLTFDATQGTGGLAACNCDIYIHTGVITNNSNGGSDWKYVQTDWGVENDAWKLTPVPGEPDRYTFTISPSINEFYDVPNGETIEELAFVFRNGDGSLEGKDQGGTDIYYPIFPANLPFSSILFEPTSRTLIKESGESIAIKYAVSEAATLTLTDNGTQLAQVTGDVLEYELSVDTPGPHDVEITADNGSTVLRESFFYLADIQVTEAALPSGAKPGITYLNNEESVVLALYAPGKDHVFLLGDFNDWTLSPDFQLQRTKDGNVWWIQIDNLVAGEEYRFQYLVDGELRIADPLSTLILDPNNDPFIPAETYPDLPEYPVDKTNGMVTLLTPGAPEYQWMVDDFERPEPGELVIYELLVRDFIERHDYQTLIDTLDYLTRLGINAIELLPVNEFEGNISWGYNPSFHKALDKYYGTINDFKRFVDICHSKGLAVIVDVVYNHAFGRSPLVQLYFDGRPTPDSPWFNRDATHPFNVGYDFNHERPATQAYVEDVMRYWLREFRLDGFRFDLSKGFTQTLNPNNVGAWGQYDASRIEILKNYVDIVWDESPGVYAIMEHFAENREETELIEYGMMVWNNINHNYSEAAMGYTDNNLEGTSYTSRNWTEPALVSYMESHDEERLMYRTLEFGNADGEYDTRYGPVALTRVELASAFFYSIPGAKMLWQFGELGYDVPIDFNGRTGPKPIRWDFLNSVYRKRLYDVTRSLIGLRNDYPVFHTDDFNLNVGASVMGKTIHLNSDDMNVTVIGNFDVVERSVSPAFQHTGEWYSYFSGESRNVTEVNAPISLKPGEFHLYTDVELPEAPTGRILTTNVAEVEGRAFDWEVVPNPTVATAAVQYVLPRAAEVQFDLYDASGRLVERLSRERQVAGYQRVLLEQPLRPGIYFVRLTVDGGVSTRKLVVME